MESCRWSQKGLKILQHGYILKNILKMASQKCILILWSLIHCLSYGPIKYVILITKKREEITEKNISVEINNKSSFACVQILPVFK